MSKYAVMPLSDYDNTCDVIREKTQNPNAITSGEMPMKVREVFEAGVSEGHTAGVRQGKADYIAELLPYNQNLQLAIQGYIAGRTDKEVMEQATSDINAIEAKIEEKGVRVDSLTPSSEFPEKIEEVYEKGYEKGKSEFDYDAVFEEGKQAQYDEFWDNYQIDKFSNKPRTQYNYAFYQIGWNDISYKPKYDFEIQYAFNMFSYNYITDTLKTLDFTKLLAAASNVFARSRYIKTIRKIIVNETTTFSGWFIEDTELENLTFEGVIGQKDLNLQWSTKLSKASWINIVGCFSSTISGLSMTGSLASVNSAFETSEGAKDGSTSAEWLNLIATRPNVSFNLV